MLCLSGFELYYRWVPLKYKPPGDHFWNFAVFLKITFIMHIPLSCITEKPRRGVYYKLLYWAPVFTLFPGVFRKF